MIANTIGVKFMLQGSHYLSVKMLASNYQNWLDHFKKTNRFASLFGTCMATGINWAICGEDVVGAHSFDWEAAQAHAKEVCIGV